MATISDQLTSIKITKTAIRDAIITKGIAVPEATPFRQYADKIAAIPQEGGDSSGVWKHPKYSGAGWTRSQSRPDVPELNNNEVYMLFGVHPEPTLCDIAFSASYCTIDWGDGSDIINVSTMTYGIEHVYDYNALDITPDLDGIKWVWIKILSGYLGTTTTIAFTVPSTRGTVTTSYRYVPFIYEIYFKAGAASYPRWSSSGSTLYISLGLLEIYDDFGRTEFNSTMSSSFYNFNQSYSLVYLNFNYSGTINSTYVFGNSNAIRILANNKFKTSGVGFLTSAQSYAGTISVAPGISGTTSITVPGGANITGIEFYNTNNLTDAYWPGVSTIYITYRRLSAEALAATFETLWDRSALSTGTIQITGNPGAPLLTTEQRAIAINKNWTITG